MDRRSFLRLGAATTAALTLGPSRWGWAAEGSPFAELQDDPILRLPEGFSYKIVAETGDLLTAGPVPWYRPNFPDLNVVFPQPDGKLLLASSHEVAGEVPLLPPPPSEDYDHVAGGAITTLLLDRDLNVIEGIYNVGGMLTNCSGSGTPWGTVLTGEEDVSTYEADHGFVWEVDPAGTTKVRLDSCGRFEHETAVVDARTGWVYLTEDSGGDSLLYRMRPHVPGDLGRGGTLEAFRAPDSWVVIEDPVGSGGATPAEQGVARGATTFARLEGGRIDGRYFYFTETEDDTAFGKVWRLSLGGPRGRDTLEIWAQGDGTSLSMPDNIVFDRAGNMFVTEDKSNASTDDPNRLVFIDRKTGEMATFAEVAFQFSTPEENIADEPTGPAFSPDGRVLFLNLQRQPDFGMTLAITGPFATWRGGKERALPAARPRVTSDEDRALAGLGLPVGATAALLALRRRGRIGSLTPDLEALARELGQPDEIPNPMRRSPRVS